MRRKRHPLSGALYEAGEDGHVRVESRDGLVGIFDANGRWISGDLRHADPHLCVWVGGPQLDTDSQGLTS